MAKIIILGAGSMGTAFSYPCSDNNHDVTIIGTHLEDDFIDLINSEKKHPILDCNIAKNVKFLKLKSLNEEINKKVDLIVVAVISKGIEWASLQLCKILKINMDQECVTSLDVVRMYVQSIFKLQIMQLFL